MAREGYLLHAGEETIHQLSAEKKPNSPKLKWDNFWYYHKLHVLIAIVIVSLLVFFVHDMTSRVNPDYEIGMITQTTYSTEAADQLESQLAKFGEDLNGDGKVVVQVNSYTVTDSSSSSQNVDPNAQMAGFVKLSADFSEGTSMIFITDDASFQAEQSKAQLFSYLDGSTPAEGAKDYNKMWKSLNACKALTNPKVAIADGKSQNLFNGLRISMRTFQGSQLEKKNDKVVYYKACKKLFDKIIREE